MQITSSTASINSTNGIARINLPVNVINIVRSTASTAKIGVDSGDLNNYPVIVHSLVTKTNQLWFYALGDEATRDADLVTTSNATSSGGNIFDRFGSLGNYFQTQSFKGSTILNSSIHNPAFQYAIPIYMGGTYTEFSMIKLVSAFTGLMNYALYDSRAGAGVPAYPNNKIFQSAEIVLGLPEQFVQSLLSPSLVLEPGIYWFSWAADGGFAWKGLGELGLLGYSVTGSTLSIPQRIFSIVPYTSTLPATWTAIINNALAGTPPMLLQIKEI